MEYVIYGDVLVAVNFIIDLLILRLCQPLTGIRQRGPRPYLAAAAGGLCSMVIFLPSNSLLLDLFIRLALSFIVVSIAYGRQRPGVFLRLLGVSEENAAADACKMEHDLSEETFERIREHALRQGVDLLEDQN